MPLLLMESDGVTNCSQKLLHVARIIGIFFAKLLQSLLQTRSLATHAFFYAVVDHCASLFLYSARRYSKSKAFGSKLDCWNESTS